ncbi:MAG: 16S rRNA (cytosine(967)-C(5))-methyltransferase RsmB [Oscillospiraceae bacterium]|nr:16S rRNA (cytosine(967)-C(5))-methyltransferase RsmB [Oscillospiraceae bacterium]
MPRKTALEALERFRRDGAWSRQVLTSLVKKNRLDARDGALAARLFYGTLQNLLLLDHYIGVYAKGRLEPKVRDILRLGVYQILFMDRIPVRAAVSQSVQLCRELRYDRAAGLVNAVLRRVGENRNALPPIPGEGTAAYLSVLYSHPLWLTEELIALRGYDGAEAVLRADNAPSPVYIQTNTLRTTPEALEKALKAQRHEELPGCLLLEDFGDFADTAEFREGLFYVQDPAAHMAVLAAEPAPGMRVLDICAAPGGKSFAAAIAMENRGEISARDVIGAKLNLVMDGAERMGLSIIHCREADARDTEAGAYDLVIADVPCSGLGVIRKKPDIRYREQTELDRLPELQEDLLEAAARAVRPGGRLLYSTCTWRTAENGGVTDGFLRRHTEFEKRLERTLWPDLDGTDGFYICRMDRKNEI